MQQLIDWTEKYRPNTLEDIVGNKSVIKALIKFRDNQNFPRLLFAGESGTGKTTSAICLARTIFDKPDFFELNASDDRGIDVVRYDINSYAESYSPYGCPFKIVILDECENMTKDAQTALRRTMERHSKNCRFILTCNDVVPLIDAIQSRCSTLEFKPLKRKQVIKVLKRICKSENVDYDKGQLKKIAKGSYGDLRKAVETLQTVAEGREEIDEEILHGIVHPFLYQNIESMIVDAMNGNFISALRRYHKSKPYLSFKALSTYVEDELLEEDDPSFNEDEKAILAIEFSKINVSNVTSNMILSMLAGLYRQSPTRTPPNET